jgi:hypothetical protein
MLERREGGGFPLEVELDTIPTDGIWLRKVPGIPK